MIAELPGRETRNLQRAARVGDASGEASEIVGVHLPHRPVGGLQDDGCRPRRPDLPDDVAAADLHLHGHRLALEDHHPAGVGGSRGADGVTLEHRVVHQSGELLLHGEIAERVLSVGDDQLFLGMLRGEQCVLEIGEKSLLFWGEWFHVAHLLLCIAVDELADRRRGSQSTQGTATSWADAADRHVQLLADLGVAQGRVGGQQREQSAI